MSTKLYPAGMTCLRAVKQRFNQPYSKQRRLEMVGEGNRLHDLNELQYRKTRTYPLMALGLSRYGGSIP